MDAYGHILVAVDLGPDCDPVARRAADLAQRYGAGMSLIHVVENVPVEPGNELMIPPTTSVELELTETARVKLKAMGERLGVPAERQQVALGQTKREILEYAEEHTVDLIVVGSHGRHGLALLLGSTANALLHGATCDLLAVRI